MGGDEFCMISHERENLLAAQRVIEDRGPGFRMSASLGIANIPDDASDGTAAIGIADRRMYTSKAARPSSVDHQVTKVLLRTLAERNGPLGGHSANVSKLACRTAEELAVGEETLRAIEIASRLHDIGKMAISDQILHKPGPLTADEWRQIRTHTLIGERIIATAPSLAEAARLLRFSHERYDGGGYPDGLAAEQIPLGARIIFACDAYDAMISERSYRPALSEAEACAELERHAGTQFDPRVVRALLSGRSATSSPA
jgi:two-component system cell cycle response regulator